MLYIKDAVGADHENRGACLLPIPRRQKPPGSSCPMSFPEVASSTPVHGTGPVPRRVAIGASGSTVSRLAARARQRHSCRPSGCSGRSSGTAGPESPSTQRMIQSPRRNRCVTFAFRPNHRPTTRPWCRFVDRTYVVGLRPQTQRVHSTWITRQPAAETPVMPMLRVAGVDSLEALTRYLGLIPELDTEAASVRLSGALTRYHDCSMSEPLARVRTMEPWQLILFVFVLVVATLLFRELARRTAFALLTAAATIGTWILHTVYWLLIGWWVSMLRRHFTGGPW